MRSLVLFLLLGSAAWAHGPSPEELVASLMEPAARALGMERDRYDFPLVIDVLAPSLSREQVAPARWYVSAND